MGNNSRTIVPHHWHWLMYSAKSAGVTGNMANCCRQLSEVLENVANLQTTRSLHEKKAQRASYTGNSAQRAQRDSYYIESEDEEEEACWMQLDPTVEEGHIVKLTAPNTLSKHFDESAAKEVSEKSAQAQELIHGETSKLHRLEPPVAGPVSIAADENRDKSQITLLDTEGELAPGNRSAQPVLSTHPTNIKKIQSPPYAPHLSGKIFASSAYSMPYKCNHCGRGLKNADSKAHHENACSKYYKQRNTAARDRQARSPLKVPSQIPRGYRVLNAPKDRDAHRVVPTWSITHKTTRERPLVFLDYLH